MACPYRCLSSRVLPPGSVRCRAPPGGNTPVRVGAVHTELGSTVIRSTSVLIFSRVAYNGLFGVGAPEALLVGVVALVVFGPQGLIEAAKAVAGTIRSIQPTIQELNQATTDIRTSISKEVGIDSLQKEFREIEQTTRDSFRLDTSPLQQPLQPGPTASTGTESVPSAESVLSGSMSNGADNGTAGSDVDREGTTLTKTAEEMMKADHSEEGDLADKENIEEMRAASAAMAWGGSVPSDQSSEDGSGKSVKKRLEDMTMAELQRELARRKDMIERIENLT